MSKYAIEQQTLSDIGGAIRDLKKTSEPIMVKNFAEEIRSVIPIEPEYPNPPDDGKSRFYIHLEEPMEVTFGHSSMSFKKIEESEKEAWVSIDWGDGSEIEYIYTSKDTPYPYINLTHTYLESGDYIITMELSQNGSVNGFGNFFGDSSNTLYNLAEYDNVGIWKYCILSGLHFYSGNNLFQAAYNLEYCRICKSVTADNFNYLISFKDCHNLKKIEFEEGLCEGQEFEYVNRWFNGCVNLTSITFPSSMAAKYGSEMYRESGLEEVIYSAGTKKPIPMPLQSPSYSAVNKSITKTILPDSIEELPNNLFYYNSMLSDVTIPPNVKKIGYYAFSGTAIKEVILPDTLIELDHSAFSECKQLQSIVLSNNPDFTAIPNDSFRNCWNVKEITIPSQITSIGSRAFFGTSISHVDIPKSVTTMGSDIFYPPNGIYDANFEIHFLSETPPNFEGNPFGGYSMVNIYVPQSAVEAYKAVEQLASYVDNIIGE